MTLLEIIKDAKLKAIKDFGYAEWWAEDITFPTIGDLEVINRFAEIMYEAGKNKSDKKIEVYGNALVNIASSTVEEDDDKYVLWNEVNIMVEFAQDALDNAD